IGKKMSQVVPHFEDYVICPYNNSHRLIRGRLGAHLSRCARSYPSSKLVRCSFNNTHLYSVTDMKNHIANCPDRVKNMKPEKTTLSTESEPKKFVVESTEDWDKEPPAPTYNPQTHCSTAFIIRNPQGAPRAERREFREKERRRLMALR
ncbi:hypothetical protein KR038_005139, partial [Drosophila bunnanda]